MPRASGFLSSFSDLSLLYARTLLGAIPFQSPAHKTFTRLTRYLEPWLAGEGNWIRLYRAVRRGGSSYRLLVEVLSPLICFRLGVTCGVHFCALWPSIEPEVGLSKTIRRIPVCLCAKAKSAEC
jgi:hypothetical protein